MPLVTVKPKFQVTIPARLRRGLREGDLLEATVVGDGILLRPREAWTETRPPTELRPFSRGSIDRREAVFSSGTIASILARVDRLQRAGADEPGDCVHSRAGRSLARRCRPFRGRNHGRRHRRHRPSSQRAPRPRNVRIDCNVLVSAARGTCAKVVRDVVLSEPIVDEHEGNDARRENHPHGPCDRRPCARRFRDSALCDPGRALRPRRTQEGFRTGAETSPARPVKTSPEKRQKDGTPCRPGGLRRATRPSSRRRSRSKRRLSAPRRGTRGRPRLP